VSFLVATENACFLKFLWKAFIPHDDRAAWEVLSTSAPLDQCSTLSVQQKKKSLETHLCSSSSRSADGAAE
jgi:hypothetical protein